MKSEVISSPEVIDSKKKNKKPVLNNSILLKIIFVIFSLAIAFFSQYFCYKPRFGTITGADMDALGNTYVLSVIEKSNQYKVTKISPQGKVEFERKLDKSTGTSIIKYRGLEVDSKGKFFLIQETRNSDSIVSNPSQYPISKECIKMYDENGKFWKDVALFDFASSSMPITSEYIKKIQIVNQKLSVVVFKENVVEIVGVNPYLDESPDKEFTFEVSPTNVNDYDWINDYSVISDGSVVYSTKNGNLFLTKQDGSSVECNSLLPNEDNSISSMYVDRLDNVYFFDLKNGVFCKFDTKSMSISCLYSIDDKIKVNDLTIKDLRKIRPINEEDFFGFSKTFKNPYFVRFGNNLNLVSDIRYKFFPYGFIFTIAGALLLIFIMFLIYRFFRIGIKRTYVSVKATLMFIPVFIIIMLSIVFYSTNKSMVSYTDVLRQNQTIGAKIVSEKINGDSLVNTIKSSEYMSPSFLSLKNAISSAYLDLKGKVGDNSDYIVIYGLDNSKMYSITNNKYSGDSKYYEFLNYADPDMTQNKVALVDSVLEKDEIENIYSIWSKLKDKDGSNVISTFRDVHGDIVGSFVPIKNSSGVIVGMVGNFLDEKSHTISKLFEILKESMVLIGIIALLVFLYLCLIVWILLKPMRIMNKGIEVMTNGHWKNRLPIVSKDEFASISVAFNNMAKKLEEYTDNLVNLNSEYLRYIPKELLNLAGKERITQVSVGEGKSSDISIVYITFNIENLKNISDIEKTLFNELQNCYSKMFDIVEDKNGIVQNFSSLGATLIFEDPVSAINSSIQLLESDIDEIIKKNLRINIGYGSSLVGVIGNEVRRGVSMASEEMLRLIKIDNGIKNLGINFTVTEYIIQNMSTDTPFDFRFVGKFKDVSDLSWVKIYQVIYSSNTLIKDLIIQTRSVFERAVQLYIEGKIDEARPLFVDVFHKNKDDKTALYYINMCDLKMKLSKEKDNLDLKNILGEVL